MLPWMLWILVFVPALGGIALPFIARRLPPATVRRIALLIGGFVLLCALGARLSLDVAGAPDLLFPLTWLPNAGEIGLRASATGLHMAMALSAGLVATLALGERGKAPDPGMLALALGALSAANVAFLVSNFLGRYVALEIVGLLVALAPLLAMTEGLRPAGLVYLLLRVGDAGFLIAVLLLRETGTLDIDAALHAGVTLSAASQTWIVLGFLLAVGVKAMVWPFGWWRSVGREMDSTTNHWLYATVMPMLGLYLLYRITPLLSGNAGLRALMRGWGAVGLLMLLLSAVISPRKSTRSAFPLNQIVGSLALILAGADAGTWVRTLAWALAPMHGLIAWLIPTTTPARAERKPAQAEPALMRVAQQFKTTVEVGILERIVTALPQAVMDGAGWLYRVIEQDHLEGLLRNVTQATLSAGHALQRWHTGRLRYNLTWVVIVLTLALAMFFTL